MAVRSNRSVRCPPLSIVCRCQRSQYVGEKRNETQTADTMTANEAQATITRSCFPSIIASTYAFRMYEMTWHAGLCGRMTIIMVAGAREVEGTSPAHWSRRAPCGICWIAPKICPLTP
jgi:hypothetical protein